MKFVWLIFLSGYNKHLSELDYWSTDPDLYCPGFWQTMTESRFFGIRSFFLAVHNQSLSDLRMAKVFGAICVDSLFMLTWFVMVLASSTGFPYNIEIC